MRLNFTKKKVCFNNLHFFVQVQMFKNKHTPNKKIAKTQKLMEASES